MHKTIYIVRPTDHLDHPTLKGMTEFVFFDQDDAERRALQATAQQDYGFDRWQVYTFDLREGEQRGWRPTEEIYFHIDDCLWEQGMVTVVTTPKEYFDRYGHLDDRGGYVDVAFLYELQESIYESTKSVEETRELLLKLGFVESDEFSGFCSKHVS